jgi:hypothetical protein
MPTTTRPRPASIAWRGLGLAALLSLSLGAAQPAAAQTFPLPDTEASVVIGAPDFVTDSTGNSLAEVYASYDAVIDPVTRKVFVLDSENYRILRFADYRTLQNGDPAEHVFGGDCDAQQNESPTCLSVGMAEIDNDGRLWLYDYNGKLVRFDDAATSTSNTYDGQVSWNNSAYGGAVNIWDIVITGADRDILVAHDIENLQFLYWDISGTPANDTLPYQTQPALLFTPNEGGHYSSLAHDYQYGGLWTLDYYWGCVRYYADPEDLSAPQGVIGAQSAECPRELNQTGLSATEMSVLSGLFASADGTLFVGDYDNYRILAFRDAVNRGKAALAAGEFVTADAVYGADDFDSYGYDDPYTDGVNPAKWIGYLSQFGGDPTNNTLVIPMEYPSSVRLFITPEMPEEQTDVVAVCDTLPDMAITPERVELDTGGSASLTVTMRNLCNDRPFQSADLLVSLSDGLTAVDGSAGLVNLGQRAAWQGIALKPGETRSWTLTTQAAAVLPTPPLHVVELYYLGGVSKRIDGVFVGATAAAPAPAEIAPAAPVVEAAPAAPAPLPQALPNTAEDVAALPLLMLAGAALCALLFGRRLVRR